MAEDGMFNKKNRALITFVLLVAVASAGYMLYLYSRGGATYIENKTDLPKFGIFLGSLGFFTLSLVYSRTILKLTLQQGSLMRRLNPVEERLGIKSFMWSALMVLNKAHPYLGLTTIALIFLHGYLVLPSLDNLLLLSLLGLLAWQGFFGILLKLKYTPSILRGKSYLVHSQLYTGILILTLAVFGHSLWVVHAGFELTGVHANLSCERCHPGDKYSYINPNCQSCHSLPSNHFQVAATCDKCHSTAGWKPATFDHSAFPLTGKHASLACDQCHTGGKYSNINPSCQSCHTVPSNHIPVAGNCDKCHSTAGWKPASFDHSAFPLTGKHASLACDQCHHGIYNGTSAMCVSCHEPPSSHDGMDTDCSQCHTSDSFTPANFLHSRVGEHIGTRVERPLSCETCHPVRFVDTTCTGSRCHSSNNARGGGDD